MRKYIVTIRRVTYTPIVVEADSMADARAKVVLYGADLAAVDFPQRELMHSQATVVRVQADRS
jgi:hypothetical protein